MNPVSFFCQPARCRLYGFEEIGPQDVAADGHAPAQSVDAGKPSSRCSRPDANFKLTRSCAEKTPELLRAVEHLSKNELQSVYALQQQARHRDTGQCPAHRGFAKGYVAKAENTCRSPTTPAARKSTMRSCTELQAREAVSRKITA